VALERMAWDKAIKEVVINVRSEKRVTKSHNVGCVGLFALVKDMAHDTETRSCNEVS
jgi:hypothetical protein